MDATLLNVKEEYMWSAQEILNINRYGYPFFLSTLYAYQLPIASRMNFVYRWTRHRKKLVHSINTYTVSGNFDDPFIASKSNPTAHPHLEFIFYAFLFLLAFWHIETHPILQCGMR